MRNKVIIRLFLSAIFVFGLVANAHALTISLHSSNVGIDPVSFSWTLSGTTIDISETWIANGYGFLEISGLESWTDYTINKHITNDTGIDWIRFSNELLDPAGQENDAERDPPYPAWVPSGFSTSNDYDGLSFAQYSGLPRTSTTFSSLIVDELSDARDFLDFYNGLVSGSGGIDLMTYGLRDKYANNQPFLLAQRPNEFAREPPIPEPTTLSLLGIGLLGLAGIIKRKRS